MAHVLTELKIIPKQHCGEAAALAKELGLGLQARRYEKPLAEDFFTALEDDEERLWRWHCPTRYFQPPVISGVRSLEDYGFDSIPIEVMRHWKAIKDTYSFDRYEIWTTERTANTDPLLVGLIGQKVYLLARWGMESPEQLPLRKIAQGIYDEFYQMALERWDFPFISKERRVAKQLEWFRKFYARFAVAERYLGKA